MIALPDNITMYKLYFGIIISGLGGWALRKLYFYAREAFYDSPTDAEVVAKFSEIVSNNKQEVSEFTTYFKGTWR